MGDAPRDPQRRSGIANLKRDLETGDWERRYGEWLTLDEYDARYQLVVA